MHWDVSKLFRKGPDARDVAEAICYRPAVLAVGDIPMSTIAHFRTVNRLQLVQLQDATLANRIAADAFDEAWFDFLLRSGRDSQCLTKFIPVP